MNILASLGDGRPFTQRTFSKYVFESFEKATGFRIGLQAIRRIFLQR